jgi:hypothetical protein
VFHVIVTFVFAADGLVANVVQVWGLVPLVEPFDVPLVTPPPLQFLTGRLNDVVWIFGTDERPGVNVTVPEGGEHVTIATAPAGWAASTPTGAISAMARPSPATFFNCMQ